MSTAAERFRSLPRAVRWLGVFVLLLAGYFLVCEPVIDLTNKVSARADDKAAKLAAAESNVETLSAAYGDVKSGLQRHGPILLPGEPKARSEALNKRINAVLQSHSVRDHTATAKEVSLSPGPLAKAIGETNTVERLVMELQFEASPETVAAVLADLERSPEVSMVSRFQVRRSTPASGGKSSGPRTLKATLAVEGWQLVRKGRTR